MKKLVLAATAVLMSTSAMAEQILDVTCYEEFSHREAGQKKKTELLTGTIIPGRNETKFRVQSNLHSASTFGDHFFEFSIQDPESSNNFGNALFNTTETRLVETPAPVVSTPAVSAPAQCQGQQQACPSQQLTPPPVQKAPPIITRTDIPHLIIAPRTRTPIPPAPTPVPTQQQQQQQQCQDSDSEEPVTQAATKAPVAPTHLPIRISLHNLFHSGHSQTSSLTGRSLTLQTTYHKHRLLTNHYEATVSCTFVSRGCASAEQIAVELDKKIDGTLVTSRTTDGFLAARARKTTTTRVTSAH